MDISKMYCRVDSEHFDEFVKLVGEQFGESFSKRALSLSKLADCKTVAISYCFRKEGGVEYSGDNPYWVSEYNYKEFTGTWSIYNNTKPLSELTDEQVGKLVKHSGEIEHMNKNTLTWCFVVTPFWHKGEVYRAKPKSERELFIEAAAKIMFDAEGGGHKINDITLGALFDAGFEAPKGGE